MKLSVAIPALCVLPAADAFVTQRQKTFTHAIKISIEDYPYLSSAFKASNGDYPNLSKEFKVDDETVRNSTSVDTFTSPPQQVSSPIDLPSQIDSNIDLHQQISSPIKATNQVSSPRFPNLPVNEPPPQAQAQGVLPKAPKTTMELFEKITPVLVHGESLKTCSFNEMVQRISVYLKTEGRPLNANVELWQGPDNSPQKMIVFLEDGYLYPFHCVVESPGVCNTVAIRNIGGMEFPLTAGIDVELDNQSVSPATILHQNSSFKFIQGGAVHTVPFSQSVESVQVVLKTDGRPLNARIELLQGPNNNKQSMEVYTEDGTARPFFVIIDTPGTGNVIRIVNTATIEFPLTAAVEPYIIHENNFGDGSFDRPEMLWK